MDFIIFLEILIISRMIHGVDTGCKKPEQSLIVTKENQYDTDIDVANYKNDSTLLPLTCVNNVDFELKKPAFARCVNNNWVKDKAECVAKIWRLRQKTETIILISGIVFGSMAFFFLFLKFVHLRWQWNQKKTDSFERSALATVGESCVDNLDAEIHKTRTNYSYRRST